MNTNGKIVIAAAAGLAAGTLLGILLAPDKGSETRKKLNEEGKKFTDDLKDTIRKGKEKFNDIKEDFERVVKEKAEQLEQKYDGEKKQA